MKDFPQFMTDSEDFRALNGLWMYIHSNKNVTQFSYEVTH